ncbi:hypothetical protein Y032_0463g1911 [Ancylostoma ceylanicum]|nr:hypothetical protein Y032_0463g1911 [Ancylostoma ceylanicum]
MIVVDKLIAVALPLKHKVWPNSLYTFSMCLPPLLIASGALFASYYSVNDVEINVCRPPTSHGVITPITILLTFTSTAAIVVMFVMLGIVIKNERSWKGSRHRKTSKPIAPSVTNKVDDSSDYYRHCCGVRMYMVFIRCEYADCI